MVWRMDYGGVMDLYFRSPMESIKIEPVIYAIHNPIEKLRQSYSTIEKSCSRLV